jgi:hypothetical protein
MKGFHTEPQGYEKGAWSDLQGAWEILRQSVVAAGPFPEAERVLFHVDEGMSWESVREPEGMRKALLLVQNTAVQAKAPTEVLECVEAVREAFDDVMEAIKEGEAR